MQKEGRILIPRSTREEILNRRHTSDQGVEKYTERAKICVYWLGVNNNIEEVVHEYSVCQRLSKCTNESTYHST